MKRHILGLALFSSIVAAAVFVSWLFYNPSPTPDVAPVVTKEVVFTKSKTSCWRDAPQTNAVLSAKVVQATFNTSTKQLESEILVEGKVRAGASVNVNLHFFSKTADGNRYLGSESFALAPNFDAENKATHSVISSFAWLDNLSSYENLYVVGERGGSFGRAVKPSSFDEVNARPVLLMRGK